MELDNSELSSKDKEGDYEEIGKGLDIVANGKIIKYTNPDCIQFVKDMQEAGMEVEHYHGRFFWYGPAVRVNELQDALSYTKVRCQSDNLGRGFIVYPKERDEGIPQ